jgi:hypothetical protein
MASEEENAYNAKNAINSLRLLLKRNLIAKIVYVRPLGTKKLTILSSYRRSSLKFSTTVISEPSISKYILLLQFLKKTAWKDLKMN